MNDVKIRCPWAGASGSLMREYHDTEWGVPTHGNREIFELLCLEGAQAGLSWNTILNRRQGYRSAFAGFDIEYVADISTEQVETLRIDERIIRNRAKIKAFVDNAAATRRLENEGTGIDEFVWSFVDNVPQVNRWSTAANVPAETELSRELSKALRERGFRFVGPVICYAFMQSAGMVNDHLIDCFRHAEV